MTDQIPAPNPPKKKTKWYWNVLPNVFTLWLLGGLNTLLLQDIPLLLFLLGVGFALIYPSLTWFPGREELKGERLLSRRRLWAGLGGMAWVLFVGAVTFALLLYVIPPFAISPQTTYLTEPRSTEFYGIDYQSVIEQQLDPGVPPEDNGFRRLAETFGRPFFSVKHGSVEKFTDKHWHRLCRYLELPAEIEPALTFVNWWEYEKTLEPEEQEIVKPFWSEQHRLLSEEAIPIVRRWLDENEAALDVFITAAQKPALYAPPMFEGFLETVYINEETYRMIVRHMVIRIHYRLATGEVDKAWDDVLIIYRLAERHRRTVWNIMSSHTHRAILGIANRAAESIMLHAGWDSDEILRRAEDVMPFQRPFHEDEIRLVLRNERLMLLEHWQHFTPFERGDAPPDFWDWFKQKNWNTFFRRGYAMVEINKRFDELEEQFFSGVPMQKDMEDELWTRFLWHGQCAIPIAIGQMVTASLDSSLEWWRVALKRHRIEASWLRLMFALEAYRRDNGEYPAALDDLRERYIDAIPLDVFSDEPFRYVLEEGGFLLYSVGPNGIDEDGRGNNDVPKGDDIRRQLPIASSR